MSNLMSVILFENDVSEWGVLRILIFVDRGGGSKKVRNTLTSQQSEDSKYRKVIEDSQDSDDSLVCSV